MNSFVFSLLSLILFLLIERMNLRGNIGLFFSHLPLIVYIGIENQYFWSHDTLLLLISYSSLLFIGISLKKIKINNGLCLIMIPWLFVMYSRIDNVVDLVIFLIGTLFVSFFLGDDKLLSKKKIVYHESNSLITYLVLGVLVSGFFIYYQGNFQLELQLRDGAPPSLLLNLMMLFLLFTLGCFGSFSRVELIINRLEVFERLIYLFIKLVGLPVIALVNVKRVLSIEMLLNIHAQTFFFFMFLAITMYFFLDLRKNGFSLKTYSIASYNMISISILYTISGDFSSKLLFLSLLLNLLLYACIQVRKNDTATLFHRSVDFVYAGAPFSPFFILKLIHFDDSVLGMSAFFKVSFCIFLFCLLAFVTPIFRKRSSYE